VGPVRPPSKRAQRISAPFGSWAIVLSPRSSLAMTAYGATLSPEQVRRRSGIHPIEPVPTGIANGRYGANPAVRARWRRRRLRGRLRRFGEGEGAVGASSGHIVARKGAVWGLTAAIRLENRSYLIRGRAEGEIPGRSADTCHACAREGTGVVSCNPPRDASRRGFATCTRDRARVRAQRHHRVATGAGPPVTEADKG
jgi:hypothetical protein